ncbi:hypothetical protein ACFTAO_24925 [Paenibacillus rhizoplanae]
MKDYPITEQQAKDMFEVHSSYIYGIALMMTKQRVLADDITQETFSACFCKNIICMIPPGRFGLGCTGLP